MNKTVFVTGGAGFIGSWIVQKLIAQQYKVIIYDNFSSGLKENIPNSKLVSVIEGDILDKKKLINAMRGSDVVIHQAAQLEITTAIAHPNIDLEVNTVGTINVLNAAKHHKILKIIMASSACIYGNQPKYPVTEMDLPTPNWEYGVSKLASEKYCDIYSAYEGLSIASLRYSIVYGEREWYGRALTIFLKRGLLGEPLIVFSDGGAKRDFIHVEDVSNLNVMLVEHEWEGHLILNVSSGKALDIKSLAELVAKIISSLEYRKIQVEFERVGEGEYSKIIKDRKRLPRELKVMHLDNQKAKHKLGWTPSINLEEGIKREYEWLRLNHQRWSRLSY